MFLELNESTKNANGVLIESTEDYLNLVNEANEELHENTVAFMRLQHQSIIKENNELLTEGLSEMWSKIKEWALKIWEYIKGWFKKVWLKLKSWFMSNLNFLKKEGSHIATMYEDVEDADKVSTGFRSNGVLAVPAEATVRASLIASAGAATPLRTLNISAAATAITNETKLTTQQLKDTIKSAIRIYETCAPALESVTKELEKLTQEAAKIAEQAAKDADKAHNAAHPGANQDTSTAIKTKIKTYQKEIKANQKMHAYYNTMLKNLGGKFYSTVKAAASKVGVKGYATYEKESTDLLSQFK